MSKKIPSNCEIELLDFDRKDRAFRLVFQATDGGDDYHSEIYYPGKGQRLKSAAYEICARYGWLDFPPSSGVLTMEELLELETAVDNAIHDMDAHPERYVPDPEKAWRDMFDWQDDAAEFFMDGADLLACGDPPIPSPDDDRDDGWTQYNYAHNVYRVIPASVAKRKAAKMERGPRGIEVISFSSGDMDGNWETEAQFVRHQKGVKLTEADRGRALAAGKANVEARDAFNKASSTDSNYGDLQRAWAKAAEAYKLANTLRGEDIEEECWDPEEFRYYAVQLNCYWTLLRHKRYEIWCALHGEDPLGNVRPETENVAGTFSVTARARCGKVEVVATLVKGDQRLESKAVAYLEGYSLEELKAFIRERPEGRQHQHGGEEDGWKPGKITVASVEFIVTLSERISNQPDAQRIRQVSCKGLAEDVKRMLRQIDKHFPKDGTAPTPTNGHES